MDSKPVDSAQVVLDNRGKKANARTGTLAGVTGSAGMNGFVFKLLAVLFVVGNVTALYVLHFVNRPSPTTRFSLTSFTATSGTSASVGDVVSLSSDSKLRNGAGTTAYLDRHTLVVAGTSSYYEYINMATLGVTASSYLTNLMSYRHVTATGKQSVLTTFTVDPVTKGVTISTSYDKTKNVVTADAIRGIATLSDTQALVMTVDDATWTYKTYLMPAAISGTSGATLNQANKVLVATGSSASYMTRLTSNSAVVAYYDPYVANTPYYQNVKIATVASDGTVSLSAATQFGPDNNVAFANWGKPVVISATSGSIVIPYYVGPSSGVCVTMSAFVSSSNTMGAFSTPVCNTNYQPTFFIDGVMLSDKVLLLAFHDKAKNNALTLVTVAITSATTAYFRSAYVFPEVAGDFDYGTQYGFSPELSLALLSGNRVAVSFLNPSMNGRQSIKVLQYSTESLAFKDVTPVVPLAPATFTLNLNGGTPDKSVTQKILAVGSDSVVAMHMGARGAMAHQHVALVESFGAPVGLLRDYNGKSEASVAISGKASEVSTKDNAKMVVGQFYYATTAGYVVTPVATTPAGAEYFIASEDAKVLVTANSKVGVAIEKDTLFVSTAL